MFDCAHIILECKHKRNIWSMSWCESATRKALLWFITGSVLISIMYYDPFGFGVTFSDIIGVSKWRRKDEVLFIRKGKPDLLLYNETKCSNRGPNVTILYVYTRPKNIKTRKFIRHTFGNEKTFYKYKLVTVFIIGRKSGENWKLLPKNIIEEYNKYGDLVVGDFIENYRNLSWKGLTALNYIRSYCQNARFVIKADDDSILDTKGILELLNITYRNRTRFLIGKVRSRGHPRWCEVEKHRWCVSKNEYSKGKYPRYLYGMGFVFSADLVSDMYNQALTLPVHPVDDIYMTGILTEGIKDKVMENLGGSFLESNKGKTLERLKMGNHIKVGHTNGLNAMKKAFKKIRQNHDRMLLDLVTLDGDVK